MNEQTHTQQGQQGQGQEVKKPKRIKTQPAMTVYLEDEPDASRRLEALSQLAREMGADNRSRLIRMIADGEITLVRSSKRAKTKTILDIDREGIADD